LGFIIESVCGTIGGIFPANETDIFVGLPIYNESLVELNNIA
jgi:hypothetical protein